LKQKGKGKNATVVSRIWEEREPSKNGTSRKELYNHLGESKRIYFLRGSSKKGGKHRKGTEERGGQMKDVRGKKRTKKVG